MKITYIGHSGFLVELEECYLLFDYFKGDLPERNLEKPFFLFASHFHHDHFTTKVFELLKEQKHIFGIFSEDIFEARTTAITEKWFVDWNRTYELPLGIKVETLESTDAGVAFLVTVGEQVVYHAGDLNDWYWETNSDEDNQRMMKEYRREIDKLTDRKIDVAFVPLDSRQGKDCGRGMAYFMGTTKAEKVVPMHFWNEPEVIDQFLEEYPQFADRVLAFRESLQNAEW